MFIFPFQIEWEPDCGYDTVTIYDGGSENAPEIGTFCGRTVPLGIKSSGHQILVKLYTDKNTVHSGFKATFEKVE